MTDVLRRGRASLAFGFFGQGATSALLVTRIPAIQDRYGVSGTLLPVSLARYGGGHERPRTADVGRGSNGL